MAWTAPTTRVTGELITSTIWNTDLVDNLLFLGNTHDHSGDAGDGAGVRRAQWKYPGAVVSGGVLNSRKFGFPAATLPDVELAAQVLFSFAVPATWQALQKLVLLVIPEGTGNLNRSTEYNIGKNGETPAFLSGTTKTVAVTNNQIFEDSLLGVGELQNSNLEKTDYVSVVYTRNVDAADTVNANVFAIGLLVEWT